MTAKARQIKLLTVSKAGTKPVVGILGGIYSGKSTAAAELMKLGCEQGYRVFDYGRSKVDTGSYHFKRHWGFEPEPLHYQYYLNTLDELPNLSPANPKYRLMIKLWQKMPFAITKVVGPPIAKYLA